MTEISEVESFSESEVAELCAQIADLEASRYADERSRLVGQDERAACLAGQLACQRIARAIRSGKTEDTRFDTQPVVSFLVKRSTHLTKDHSHDAS